MRFTEFKVTASSKINEASGIFNRQAGQQFLHMDTNHILTFTKIDAYPSDAEQFQDTASRDAAVELLDKGLDQPIQWTNAPTAGTLAFGLAYLVDDQTGADGQPEEIAVFGRYFKKVAQAGIPASWQNNQFHGYRLQTGAATKIQTGLTPQDILGVEEKRYRGLESLMKEVRISLDDKPQVLTGFENLAAGQFPITMEGQKSNLTAIRDYAGEVLQPIGIMAGVIKGGVDAAAADLLNGTSWNDLDLYWPAGKNHNLVDSIFVRADGLEIGISSKGKDGADASMKNISDAILKAKNENKKLYASYPKVVEICDIVNDNNAEVGPLILAKHLKLIDDTTAKFISEMKRANMSVEDIQTQKAQILEVYHSFGARLNHPNYNIYNHMVTNVAKMCAKQLNSDANFGTGMMEFMKQASIIQVYTDAKVNGDDVVVTGFRSVYPPQFAGVIMVNGGKNYASTKITGKLAFKMPSGKPL
jgi:flagellin-like hook-associated protein FlgL